MFKLKTDALALMGAASPDLEKQGFLAVVFVNREYSGQQETAPSTSTKLRMTIQNDTARNKNINKLKYLK
jgi:hypothetical protein